MCDPAAATAGFLLTAHQFFVNEYGILWLRDTSVTDCPGPDVLAQEIANNLQTALDQFAAIAADLKV